MRRINSVGSCTALSCTWNVALRSPLTLRERPFVSITRRWSLRLSNRKPAKASKHARSPNKPKRATQARATQARAAQAIVRSPRNNRLRPVAADSDESSLERHNDANQEARLVENPAIALQDDYKQPVTDSDPEKSPFSLATASVQAYQAKLLEVTQANMQFAFEFAQRLAAIRSPVEYLSVIAAFTSKRIDMFRKHSKEIAELNTWR